MTHPFNLNRFAIVTRATEEDMLRLMEEAESGDIPVYLAAGDRQHAVVMISRMDELPLGIEREFEDWFRGTGIRPQYKDIAKQTWFTGLQKGIELVRKGEV
jgi:hypothetical protein